MSIEKRRFARISVELPVTVYLYDNKEKSKEGEALAGRIRNFSPVGAALAVPTILLNGRHLFYTCLDNPDMLLELEFTLSGNPEKSITVPATPVWFDRDHEAEETRFVVGLKFLADAKSQEIKSLCREACQDEMMLVSLWKKLF